MKDPLGAALSIGLLPAAVPAPPPPPLQVPSRAQACSAGAERQRQLQAEAAASPYVTLEKVGWGVVGLHGLGAHVAGWPSLHHSHAFQAARLLPPLTGTTVAASANHACLQERLEAAAQDPAARAAARPPLAQPRDIDGEG